MHARSSGYLRLMLGTDDVGIKVLDAFDLTSRERLEIDRGGIAVGEEANTYATDLLLRVTYRAREDTIRYPNHILDGDALSLPKLDGFLDEAQRALTPIHEALVPKYTIHPIRYSSDEPLHTVTFSSPLLLRL